MNAFREQVASIGIEFEDGDLERLGEFLELLLEANRQFNLTAVRDIEQGWMRHIFDSLTLLPYLDAAGAERVCDVGSGGGLPGVPLAIVLPAVQFTLLEATGKKARFLEQTAARLGLGNVRVVSERSETLGQDPDEREQYDVVLARAVGPLRVLLELTVPLARVGGHVLAIKGEKAASEIEDAARALKTLKCEIAETHRTATGTIVVVEKVARTLQAYPRRPGEPKRAPL